MRNDHNRPVKSDATRRPRFGKLMGYIAGDFAKLSITQSDERDSTWDHHHPRFRVYLHGSTETSTHGWTDTYDITGADVMQVIDWAQRQAGDVLTYAVALVYDDEEQDRINPGHGRGLVWLVGMDGNDGTDAGSFEEQVQQRMLFRRQHPAVIGVDDQMPSTVLQPYVDGTQSR